MLNCYVSLKLLRHTADADSVAELRVIAITIASRKDCVESSMLWERLEESRCDCLSAHWAKTCGCAGPCSELVMVTIDRSASGSCLMPS